MLLWCKLLLLLYLILSDAILVNGVRQILSRGTSLKDIAFSVFIFLYAILVTNLFLIILT